MSVKLKQLLTLKELGKVHIKHSELLEKEVQNLTIKELSELWLILGKDPVKGNFTYSECSELLGYRAINEKIYIFK